jgi:hypothetical protein
MLPFVLYSSDVCGTLAFRLTSVCCRMARVVRDGSRRRVTPGESLLQAHGVGRLVATMPLTDTDRDILALEESWWTRPGSKGATIRERLGMSPAWYYRRLAELIDLPEAREHAPLVVRRLQRRRAQRRRDRFEGAAVPHQPRS